MVTWYDIINENLNDENMERLFKFGSPKGIHWAWKGKFGSLKGIHYAWKGKFGSPKGIHRFLK